jgi:hypothetical protein
MDQKKGLTLEPAAPRHDLVRRRVRLGIRVALEEMLVGRNYARVEDILRALDTEVSEGALDHQAGSVR